MVGAVGGSEGTGVTGWGSSSFPSARPVAGLVCVVTVGSMKRQAAIMVPEPRQFGHVLRRESGFGFSRKRCQRCVWNMCRHRSLHTISPARMSSVQMGQ